MKIISHCARKRRITYIFVAKSMNWDEVFGSTSQTENLYDFLEGNCDLKSFANGFYPKSKNKKMALLLTQNMVPKFKKVAEKLFNISGVGSFSSGKESQKRKEYLSGL